MTADLDHIRAAVAKTREAQGLPATVDDALTIGHIAAMLRTVPTRAKDAA